MPKQTRRTPAQWNALSDAQRKRYIGAGRTGKLTGTPGLTPAQARQYYLSGGSLTAARGKHTPRPSKKQAPPAAAARAAARGEATNAQLKQLQNWQDKRAPKWIRQATDLSEDTAAILAGMNLQPQNWGNIRVFPRDNGTFIVYVSSKKGGPERVIRLPDENSLDELKALTDRENNRRISATGNIEAPQIVVTSGRIRTAEPGAITSPPPTRREGRALPRKAKK